MRFRIPLQIIELEQDNFHLLVKGVFSDGAPVNWVIDTGASKSVFDKNLQEKYTPLDDASEQIHSAGIGDEPLETSLGILKTFSLGKLKIETSKMALLDLAKINELYSKSVDLKIGGLLGGDFLVKYQAVIDYKKRLLMLRK